MEEEDVVADDDDGDGDGDGDNNDTEDGGDGLTLIPFFCNLLSILTLSVCVMQTFASTCS